MTTNKLLKAADCEMKVVCGKQWDELNTTEQDGIRFCGDCKKRGCPEFCVNGASVNSSASFPQTGW